MWLEAGVLDEQCEVARTLREVVVPAIEMSLSGDSSHETVTEWLQHRASGKNGYCFPPGVSEGIPQVPAATFVDKKYTCTRFGIDAEGEKLILVNETDVIELIRDGKIESGTKLSCLTPTCLQCAWSREPQRWSNCPPAVASTGPWPAEAPIVTNQAKEPVSLDEVPHLDLLVCDLCRVEDTRRALREAGRVMLVSEQTETRADAATTETKDARRRSIAQEVCSSFKHEATYKFISRVESVAALRRVAAASAASVENRILIWIDLQQRVQESDLDEMESLLCGELERIDADVILTVPGDLHPCKICHLTQCLSNREGSLYTSAGICPCAGGWPNDCGVSGGGGEGLFLPVCRQHGTQPASYCDRLYLLHYTVDFRAAWATVYSLLQGTLVYSELPTR